MAGAGVLVSGMGIISAIAKRHGLPYMAIMGTSSVVLALSMLCFTNVARELVELSRSQRAWCLLRGFFGTSAFALHVVSIIAGAPVGDTSALLSVNVVFAAVLGRIFLKEPLRALHAIALIASVTGAVLVSRPESLLGSSSSSAAGIPWLGYGCALLSGVLIAGGLIAARKSEGIPYKCMLVSVFAQEAVLFWALMLTGLFGDTSLPILETDLTTPLLMCAAVLFCNVFATLMINEGGRLCPAAASSTIFTSVNLLCSYIAQVTLLDEMPQLMTLIGVALMLLAVVLMALARWLYNEPKQSDELTQGSSATSELASDTSGSTCAHQAALTNERSDGSTCVGDDRQAALTNGRSGGQAPTEESESESLASFIASEFSGLSDKDMTGARQRRLPMGVAVSVLPAVHAIGAASA